MSKSDSFFNPDQYATVAERIELFYTRYPQGRINTQLISRDEGEITFKALVYRSADDTFAAATGWACEREGDSDINTVACLENTETSAVGRALANLGFIASTKRPSREEMEKVARVRGSLTFRQHHEFRSHLRAHANVAEDALQLLSTAQQRGFSSQRASILTEGVSHPGMSASRVRKIEASLRAWMRRHEV